MRAIVMTLAALAVTSGIGWFFFRTLAYIEGRPVLRRRMQWALSLPLGGGILALAIFALRTGAGYQAHPLGEAACGLVFAALAACAVSALGMVNRQASRRTLRRAGLSAQMFSSGKKAVPFKKTSEELLCISAKIQDISA